MPTVLRRIADHHKAFPKFGILVPGASASNRKPTAAPKRTTIVEMMASCPSRRRLSNARVDSEPRPPKMRSRKTGSARVARKTLANLKNLKKGTRTTKTSN